MSIFLEIKIWPPEVDKIYIFFLNRKKIFYYAKIGKCFNKKKVEGQVFTDVRPILPYLSKNSREEPTRETEK